MTSLCLLSFESGIDVMATQHVANGNLVDGMAEIVQRPLDSAVSPRRGWLGHANDELFDRLINTWPTWSVSFLATVERAGKKLVITTHEGIGDGNSCRVSQPLMTQGMS